MKYIVGYRGYEIIRETQEPGQRQKPFQIWRNGKLASPGEFWDFASARREVDYLQSQGPY